MPWDYIETVIPREKSNFVFRVIKLLKLVIYCENFLQTRISNTLKDIHDAYNEVKGLPQGTISVTRKNSLEISIHHDRRLPTFGYSVEDISMLVLPMIRNRLDLIQNRLRTNTYRLDLM